MSETKNTKTRNDQDDPEKEVAPLTPAPDPVVAGTTWKYVGPTKAASVRFADDPRLYKANALSNHQVDRLIAESPHTEAWYQKA